MEGQKYSQPGSYFVHNSGDLARDETATLSDEESGEYLKNTGFGADTKRYRANPDYLLREIAGESILVPVNENGAMTNCMFSMNETSLFLWKQFQKPNTIDGVVMQAMQEFNGTKEVLERDIRAFVTDYLSAGLLKEEFWNEKA